MANNATITKARVIENSAAVLMARIAGSDGTPIVQADISGLTVKVYNNATGDQVGSTLTPAVVEVLYDTLQTGDTRWDDADGFNFELELAGSYFPEGGATYQIELKFTPVAGNAFYVLWQLTTLNIYSE